MIKDNNIPRNEARVEDVKICERCGEMIIGEYDYVQTKRHIKLYFHKGMNCRRLGLMKRQQRNVLG